MPEGDSIFRTARALHRALAGSSVTRFDSVLPALMRVDHDRPLAGRAIEAVTARGKHLLISFSDDLVLHTHMRMNGSWHLYRPGERWRRPARDMRVLIETKIRVAVGFNVPVAEFLSRKELSHHKQLQALGPNVLDPEFDREEVTRRMRERRADSIADVLLNQRVMAGVGNVFKSEVLFTAAIHPFTPVGELSGEELDRIIDQATKLMRASVLEPARTLRPDFGRRTTRRMDPSAGLWVYGRAGRPCRTCGTAIRAVATGLDARLTYWCSRCQPKRDSDRITVST
jgi:endonuclease-8